MITYLVGDEVLGLMAHLEDKEPSIRVVEDFREFY